MAENYLQDWYDKNRPTNMGLSRQGSETMNTFLNDYNKVLTEEHKQLQKEKALKPLRTIKNAFGQAKDYVVDVTKGIMHDPKEFFTNVGRGAESMAYQFATPVDNLLTLGLVSGGSLLDAFNTRFMPADYARKQHKFIGDVQHNLLEDNADRNLWRAKREGEMTRAMGINNSATVANSVKEPITGAGMGNFATGATATAIGAHYAPKLIMNGLRNNSALATYLKAQGLLMATESIPAITGAVTEHVETPVKRPQLDIAEEFRQGVRDQADKNPVIKYAFPLYGIQRELTSVNPKTNNTYLTDSFIPVEGSVLSLPGALGNMSWYRPSGNLQKALYEPANALPVEAKNFIKYNIPVPAISEDFKYDPSYIDGLSGFVDGLFGPGYSDSAKAVLRQRADEAIPGSSDLADRLAPEQMDNLLKRLSVYQLDALGIPKENYLYQRFNDMVNKYKTNYSFFTRK
jgi:hypothetical protein